MEETSTTAETNSFANVQMDALRAVSNGLLNTACMPLEEQNKLLLDFLLFIADAENDVVISARLKAIKNGGDETWHEHWLEDMPWIRELFFKYYVLGERAIAEAECYLMGEVDGYRRSFEKAFEECLKYDFKSQESDNDAINGVEDALCSFEKDVANSAVSVETTKTHILLRIIHIYSLTAGRQDLVDRLKIAVEKYMNRCEQDGIKDAGFRCGILKALTGGELSTLHGTAYMALKNLCGEYSGKGSDARRKDNVPFGFDRNIRIIACADAVARYAIDNRFRRVFIPKDTESEKVAELLLNGKSARVTYQRLSMYQLLPERLTTRIIGHRLLNSILFQMSQSAVWDWCYSNKKQGKIRIANRLSRSDGWQGYYVGSEDEKRRLNGYAGGVVCRMMGWDSPTMKESANADDRSCENADGNKNDENKRCLYQLQRWVEDRAGQTGLQMTHVPVLKVLDGGLTFTNLKNIISDIASSVMRGDFYSSEEVANKRKTEGIDETGKGDLDNGDAKRVKVNRVEDKSALDPLIERENMEIKKLMYSAMSKVDEEFADYLWLIYFGTDGFDESHIEESMQPLLHSFDAELKIPKKYALEILGRKGQPHWEENMAKKILSKHFESIRSALDPVQAEAVKKLLQLIRGNK